MRRRERDVGEYVREEPLTALAIAGGVGFIFGGGAQQPHRAGAPDAGGTNRAARRGHHLHRRTSSPANATTREPDRATSSRRQLSQWTAMTTEEQISAIQTERDDARQDLRDTLTDVNDKVGQRRRRDASRPRYREPCRSAPSLIAGAMGFLFGSIVNSRGAGPIVIAAIARRRDLKTRLRRRQLKSHQRRDHE